MNRKEPPNCDALTKEDKYYLRANLELSPEGDSADPQAQRVYATEANVIDFLAPIWTAGEVETNVRANAARHGILIKLRWREQNGGVACVGRGGGTILLNTKGNPGEYASVNEGEHLASIVLHELAHVLTPHRFRRSVRYPSYDFQSHGPEFVRCYLDPEQALPRA